jgi:exonuclease VII small subunit
MNLQEIVKQLESERDRLDKAIAALKGTAGKKRTMSAAGRAKIAAAQRLRWKKQKAKKS